MTIKNKYRTHSAGLLSIKNEGEQVILSGFVHSIRAYKKHSFVELREESGLVQLFIKNELINELSEESVISIEGKCIKRMHIHPNLQSFPTGEIEINVTKLTVINLAKKLPFNKNETPLEPEILANKPLHMRWNNNLYKRAAIIKSMRNYLENLNFVEVETPVLVRNTPGGANPYLVPFNNQNYALAQSPQIWKQLLICGGMERYYQLAHCFRNEGSRPERQPEFSQFEIEMSFVTEEEILLVMENLVKEASKSIDVSVPEKFPRYTYAEALALFGSEKPHAGIPYRLISNPCQSNERFNIGEAKVILEEKLSIEEEKLYLKQLWEAVGENGIVEVNFNEIKLNGPLETIQLALGSFIKQLSEKRNNIKAGIFPVWVTNFPMFEEGENGEILPAHHPFTRPIGKLNNNYTSIQAAAFDLAINGYEVGGGSMRIFEPQLQREVFKLLNWEEEVSEEHFKPLFEALERGAPPHGGMALGVERLCCVLMGLKNIREVMAFPKTNSGQCLLTNALS